MVVRNFDKCLPFILYFSCFVNIWRLKGMMEGFLSMSEIPLFRQQIIQSFWERIQKTTTDWQPFTASLLLDAATTSLMKSGVQISVKSAFLIISLFFTWLYLPNMVGLLMRRERDTVSLPDTQVPNLMMQTGHVKPTDIKSSLKKKYTNDEGFKLKKWTVEQTVWSVPGSGHLDVGLSFGSRAGSLLLSSAWEWAWAQGPQPAGGKLHINIIQQSLTKWSEYMLFSEISWKICSIPLYGIILCIWGDLCIPPTCQCRQWHPQSASQKVPAAQYLVKQRKLLLFHEPAGCSQTLHTDTEM